MAGSISSLGIPCIKLLMLVMIERIVLKGLSSNLISYFTEGLAMDTATAAQNVHLWNAWTWLTPLFTALLGDLGNKYWTVFGFACFFVAGLTALTILISLSCSSISIMFCLYVVSIAQGGYKSSLDAFARDQLDTNEEVPGSSCSVSKDTTNDAENKNRTFVSNKYCFVLVGCTLSVIWIPYIQETLGWIWGFGILIILMVVSLVAFSYGRQNYIYRQSEPGLLGKMVKAIKALALRLWNDDFVVNTELMHPILDENSNSSNHGNWKNMLRLWPIWLNCVIFGVVFQQPATLFTKQGMKMDRRIGNLVVPPAAFQCLVSLTVLILTIVDKLILIVENMGATRRLCIGIFVSAGSMALAAMVESPYLKVGQTQPFETAPISIFWLFPQYFLVGLADMFAVPGIEQLFLAELPTMRIMAFAVSSSIYGGANLLNVPLITVYEKFGWLNNDDISKGRLDKIYWFLALASALNFLSYLGISTLVYN